MFFSLPCVLVSSCSPNWLQQMAPPPWSWFCWGFLPIRGEFFFISLMDFLSIIVRSRLKTFQYKVSRGGCCCVELKRAMFELFVFFRCFLFGFSVRFHCELCFSLFLRFFELFIFEFYYFLKIVLFMLSFLLYYKFLLCLVILTLVVVLLW